MSDVKYIDFNKDYHNAKHISEGMQITIENYLCHGFSPGSFTEAVLSNDLVRAISTADHWNKPRLEYIVKWIQFNAPEESWGSYSKVKNWINDKDGIRTTYFDKLSKDRVWEILHTR